MHITEMSWVKDFRLFAGETSAHGVKNIFEGPSKVLKMLFLLCWIAASIYSCYIIISSIVRFINVPTGTKFEVIVDTPIDGRPQTIKFPTISVCSHNKVKKSYLEIAENAAVKEYQEIMGMYDSEEKEKQRLPERLNDPEDPLYAIRDMKYQDMIEQGGPQPNRLLMCQQRAILCEELPAFNNSSVYTMENSITGLCWRVNPDGLLKGKMGDYGRLQLMFWADVQDYGARTSDSPAVGFTVAFHDNSTFGSTMSSGFLMSPGTYYKADLRLKEEIRRAKTSGGECDPDLVHTTYGAYGEGACILECKDKHLNDSCGCINVVPPLNNGTYQPCTLQQWTVCGLDAYLQWFRNFTDPERAESFCPCATACSETRYEAQVSSSSVSQPYAAKMLTRVQYFLNLFSNPDLNISYSTEQDILDNVMVLDVLFTSMQKSEIKEIITYGFANLLGDIGGVLGLFLGASLFTILEFFQFLLFSVNKHCCNLGRQLPTTTHTELTDKEQDKEML